MIRVTSSVTLFVLSLLAFTAHAEQNFFAVSYHDVRHDVVGDYDPDQLAISIKHLAAHFAWLGHHGYTPISIDDLIAASRSE